MGVVCGVCVFWLRFLGVFVFSSEGGPLRFVLVLKL